MDFAGRIDREASSVRILLILGRVGGVFVMSEETERYFVFRGSDGRRFDVKATSPVSYLMEPIFIWFFLICFLLIALLIEPRVLTIASGPQMALIWGVILIASLCWIAFVAAIYNILLRRGIVREVLTPVAIYPLVIVGEATFQTSVQIIDPDFFEVYNIDINLWLRVFFALACFDILHSRFVVPRHPLAIGVGPEPDMHVSAIANSQTVDATPPKEFLEIGSEKIEFSQAINLDRIYFDR